LSQPSLTPTGNFRWFICGLLFLATTINYLDRQVLSLLKPALESEFHWTEIDYSNIVMAFTAAYALGYLFFGKIVDYIGTKLGYALSVFLWSIAAMAHAAVGSTAGFVFARVGLGLSEGGNFPASIKATAEWFPIKDRALATGIFNSGTNIGAVVAPILIPWILGNYGWQEAFLWTGALGFLWLILWMYYYEIPSRHKKISKSEYDLIHSDAVPGDTSSRKITWGQVLRIRQAWVFILGKFLTDPVWWFFLFWLPAYFSSAYAIDLKKPNWQLAIVYTATTIGSIGGGFLSSYLIRKGWPVFKARQRSMLLYAFLVLPVMTAPFAGNIWIAVALISMATAAHQAWSANLYTTVSDMFPKHAVSTVVGVGGMAGSIGGMLFPIVVGRLLEFFKQQGSITTGYTILFIVCGFAYLIAWRVMKLLSPTMEKVKLG
jgi:MFS transporter, ACS family, hexuronate transporter